MPESFDPYLNWLGIRDPKRPPNHYRLLGVDLYESDPEVLIHAADRQMAHVRTFQAGKHSVQSQRLLNELATAKVCLLNAAKKAEYDFGLRAEEEVALRSGLVPPPVDAHRARVAPDPRIGPPPPPQGGSVDRPSFVTPPLPEPTAPMPAFEPIAAAPIASKTSAVSLAIGGLVAAAVVVGAVIVLWSINNSKQDETESTVTTQGTDNGEEPQPEPKPKPEPKPEPEPEPRPEPKPEPKPGQLSPAAQSLAAARAAMRSRDLVGARKHLASAEKAAVDAGDKKEVRQLASSLLCLNSFWIALVQGLKEVKAGEELVVGGRRISVAEVKNGQLLLREGDKQEWYSSRTLAPDVALAIAQRQLPEEVKAAVLYKAAVMIFEPKGNRELAFQFCREASDRGLVADDLLAELKLVYKLPEIKPKPEPKPEPEPEPEPKPPVEVRLPVPAAAAQNEASREIHELFKEDFAKAATAPATTAPAARRALANMLFQKGQETRDDPTARYTLFSEAREQALEAGDGGLFQRILAAVGKEYEEEAAVAAAAVLQKASKKSRDAAGNRAMAGAALSLAKMAIRKDEFDAALTLAEAAREMARKTRDKDTTQVKQAVALLKEIEIRQQAYAAVVKAEKTLEDRPDDAEANLLCGKHYCFAKNDWERGRPMLAQGSDAAFKALAEADMAEPTEAKGIVDLGDGWWEAAGSADEFERPALEGRAVFWYEKALRQKDLTGLTRTKVERRVKEFRER